MKKYLAFFILLIFLFLTGCEIFDAAVERAVDQTQIAKPKNLPKANNTSSIKQEPTRKVQPTSTKNKIPTMQPCTSANSVTINEVGQSLEVCGKVTFVGEETCPNCPKGYYSYLVLDDSFHILSYEWIFYSDWVGDCIMVKDKVEPFGSRPAFIFGKREGYDGSECEILPDGTLTCKEGDYFKNYSGCR